MSKRYINMPVSKICELADLIPSEFCSTDDLTQLSVVLKTFIEEVAELEFCYNKTYRINNFSGTTIDISTLVPMGDTVDYSTTNTFWNGQLIGETTDYTLVGSVVTFNEPQDDCNLAFEIKSCEKVCQ